MARSFANTQTITYGSDGSIDNFTSHTIALHLKKTSNPAAQALICSKQNAGGTLGWAIAIDAAGLLYYSDAWSTGGQWTGPTLDAAHHSLVITYNGASTANDPIVYLDGASVSVTETIAPTGTRSTDAAQTLRNGSATSGIGFIGAIGHWTYDDAIWTPQRVLNYHNTGRPGGAVEVYHPFTSSADLTNHGTATADATVTGATMVGLVRPLVPMIGDVLL